jgi:hypothetical protein
VDLIFVASAAASSAYLTRKARFSHWKSVRWRSRHSTPSERWFRGGANLVRLDHRHGSKTALCAGYFVGAALMILGALVEAWIGVPAERRSLKNVAAPLSCRELE